LSRRAHSGMWRREKNGVCKRNFFKTLGCIEKFFGREGDIYKIFKSWGGCVPRTPWSPHPWAHFFHLFFFYGITKLCIMIFFRKCAYATFICSISTVTIQI
jgi:hypothetical protein